MRPDPYEATNEQLRDLARVRVNLDNWMITISTALMAAPALLGQGGIVESVGQWWVLLTAYACLGLAIIATLAHHVIGLRRREKWIALTFGIEARRPPFTTEDLLKLTAAEIGVVAKQIAQATAETLAETKTAQKKDEPLQRLERHLQATAFAAFVLGVLLFGVLALARHHPNPIVPPSSGVRTREGASDARPQPTTEWRSEATVRWNGNMLGPWTPCCYPDAVPSAGIGGGKVASATRSQGTRSSLRLTEDVLCRPTLRSSPTSAPAAAPPA